eukprot:8835597-Pyramimonas_sp.AAC.1
MRVEPQLNTAALCRGGRFNVNSIIDILCLQHNTVPTKRTYPPRTLPCTSRRRMCVRNAQVVSQATSGR